MKKISVALAAFVALSSTVAFADTNTPAVREMNKFETVLKKAAVKPNASSKASEFVIYHQEAPKPCAGKHGERHGKKRHHAEKKAEKKTEKKAHHKKHHGAKAAAKPASESK